MELAIPIVAIGGLYVACNKKKEGFKSLPNTNNADMNYPDLVDGSETEATTKLSSMNKYAPNVAYTDKFFENNTLAKDAYEMGDATYYSLTGETVDSSYFEHANMMPFNGSLRNSKIKDFNSNEHILDNKIGSGTQFITKSEQAPLFAPEENTQYSHGAPNQTEFMRSRVNPSLRMANTKPFQEEQVAPGLGLGYTNKGADGFNSGMMDRKAWMPKTVDELRVTTDPKVSYNLLGYEGPANSYIKARGEQGVQEKHRPETSFEMKNDRYMTTTGLEKGQTLRAIPIDRHVSRPDTAVSYSGVAAYGNNSYYLDGEHNEPHRQQLDSYPLSVANAVGHGSATETDYGIKSKHAYPNNRSSNMNDGYFGAIGGAFGAALSPLLDALKPTRKENTIGNMRLYENPKSQVNASYAPNSNTASTTNREITENGSGHLNFHGNIQGAHQVTPHQQSTTTRQTQGDFCYVGAGTGSNEQRSYVAELNQRNNDVKSSTIKSRLVQGNMKLGSDYINQSMKSQYSDLISDREAAPSYTTQTPSVTNMGTMIERKPLDENINVNRMEGDLYSVLKTNPYAIPYKSK
tara:strand:+ start:2629 stop:4356 length:1728 start_codon:yes stop_codon:yes gene_type:complete